MSGWSWSNNLNTFWLGANGAEYIAYKGSHHIFVFDCDKYPGPPEQIIEFTRRIETADDFDEALNTGIHLNATYARLEVD